MQTVNLMNSALKDLDLEPMTIVEDDPMSYRTNITRGSSFIAILRNTAWNFDDIRLSAAIVELPKENILPLYRFLLEQHCVLLGDFCFGVVENTVFGLETINYVSKLSPKEILEKLDQFSSTADKYDDEISSRFGAEHIGYKLGLG